MPELKPKTLNDEGISDEVDSKSDEGLNWNAEDEDQIPELQTTYRE